MKYSWKTAGGTHYQPSLIRVQSSFFDHRDHGRCCNVYAVHSRRKSVRDKNHLTNCSKSCNTRSQSNCIRIHVHCILGFLFSLHHPLPSFSSSAALLCNRPPKTVLQVPCYKWPSMALLNLVWSIKFSLVKSNRICFFLSFRRTKLITWQDPFILWSQWTQ